MDMLQLRPNGPGFKVVPGGAVKRVFTVGDGTTTSFPLTHNLGTRALVWSVRNTATNAIDILIDVVATTDNEVTVTFGTAPPAGGREVTLIG